MTIQNRGYGICALVFGLCVGLALLAPKRHLGVPAGQLQTRVFRTFSLSSDRFYQNTGLGRNWLTGQPGLHAFVNVVAHLAKLGQGLLVAALEGRGVFQGPV